MLMTVAPNPLLARDHEQHDARDNHRNARPAGNDGRLLFRDRELERPRLSFMRFLRVVEVTVDQADATVPSIFVPLMLPPDVKIERATRRTPGSGTDAPWRTESILAGVIEADHIAGWIDQSRLAP